MINLHGDVDRNVYHLPLSFEDTRPPMSLGNTCLRAQLDAEAARSERHWQGEHFRSQFYQALYILRRFWVRVVQEVFVVHNSFDGVMRVAPYSFACNMRLNNHLASFNRMFEPMLLSRNEALTTRDVVEVAVEFEGFVGLVLHIVYEKELFWKPQERNVIITALRNFVKRSLLWKEVNEVHEFFITNSHLRVLKAEDIPAVEHLFMPSVPCCGQEIFCFRLTTLVNFPGSVVCRLSFFTEILWDCTDLGTRPCANRFNSPLFTSKLSVISRLTCYGSAGMKPARDEIT